MDEDDWFRLGLSRYAWNAKSQGDSRLYVVANVWEPTRNKQVGLRMHRLILAAPPHLFVDHVSGDTLDNRRSNLRLATNAQNQQNASGRAGSSRFKGVSWDRGKERWRVAFRWDGKHHFVGTFADEEEAARAYDAAILPLAGEFARLNFSASGFRTS